MQQLKIVENFVKKKYPGINIIGCKTIREKNGIAYSSRNLLLSNNDKKIASKIYKVLSYQKNKVINKSNVIKKSLIHFQNKHFISQVKSKECELHHSFIETISMVVWSIRFYGD